MSNISFQLKHLAVISGLFAMLIFQSCNKEKETPTPAPTTNVYEFSPMLYSGQTARILLVDTLMKIIKGAEKVGASPIKAANLVAIYDNTAGLFADVSAGKKISDKVFGGVGGALDVQIRAWFDSLETRSALYAGSSKAVITEEGINLVQFIEKTIMGGLLYYQAIDYLVEKTPLGDNNTVKEGEGTAKQHYWDEGFGYFGASRYYLTYSDADISKNPSFKDQNGDGKINPQSEQNFYFARYAGSRDIDFTVYSSKNYDFTTNIFNAFYNGRVAINNKNNAEVNTQTDIVLKNWDMILGANVIKYAEDCKTSLTNKDLLSGKWAELYLFHNMTQYNKSTKITKALKTDLDALIGNKPADIDTEKLNQIITKYKTAYQF